MDKCPKHLVEKCMGCQIVFDEVSRVSIQTKRKENGSCQRLVGGGYGELLKGCKILLETGFTHYESLNYLTLNYILQMLLMVKFTLSVFYHN